MITAQENGYPENFNEEKLFGMFDTQEELDAQHNLQKAVPNFLEYAQYYKKASIEVRSLHSNRQTFEYGQTLRERLTVYPAKEANAPVMLFIHGGYWRMGSGDDFDFIATGPLDADFTVVIITYALAPGVAIPEIVREVRASIAWTAKNISALNGNPDQIYVAGHSAGAHLAAMATVTRWADYGLAPDTIKGILAISGLYDLQPVSHTFIQPSVRITAEHILTCSPLRLIKPSKIPVTVSWGALETTAFRKQSSDYLNAWKAAGNTGTSNIIAGADHFSILKEFQSTEGQLTLALKKLLADS